MAVCLRGRLMFCLGSLGFWLSTPDDERPYSASMCYKHNASLRHLACRQDRYPRSAPEAATYHEGRNEKRHEEQPVL